MKAREEYVRHVTRGDRELGDRVCLLLKGLQQQESFLEVPVVNLDATDNRFGDGDAVGQQIGPYKLRELIGEGGMGVVYVAEQESPVRRKVALKLIKPGRDTKEVIARFETERQALAMMDHPNIARFRCW